MKDTDWIILNELYKEPNLTKVSEKLYYSQPSLTKIIQNIEEEFDTRILLRSSKGVKFTVEGEYFAKRAKEYLKFMEETKNKMKSFKYETRGRLNLGSSYTYSKYFLPDILYNYSKENNVNFNIVTKQSEDLFRDIYNLDGAFIHGKYDGNIESILVDVEKAYILSKNKIELEDLKDMPMINYSTNNKTKDILNNWWSQNFNAEPTNQIFSGYVDVAWQLVNRNLGYVCCFLSENFINDYGLCMTPMLDENGEQLTRETYFVYSKTQDKSNIFEDFLEYLKNRVIIKK